MSKLKKSSSGMAALMFALTAAACHPVERNQYYGGQDGKNDEGKGAASDHESNSLIKNSSDQRSFLTFQSLDESRPAHPVAGKPMTAMVSLAVGGQIGEEEGTAWNALAASFASSTANANGADSGSLYLSDAGVVSLVDDSGQVISLGRIDQVGLDNPIKLNPGVKPVLLVEGSPFDVAVDDKHAAGMSMAFSVP